MFKIGDLVEVHNPDRGYGMYKWRIGTVYEVPNTNDEYYHVAFDNDEYDADAFNTHEIRLAKNQIVLNILNDL